MPCALAAERDSYAFVNAPGGTLCYKWMLLRKSEDGWEQLPLDIKYFPHEKMPQIQQFKSSARTFSFYFSTAT